MNRPVHYVLAVLFAGVLTSLVALTTRSATTLLGIFVTYALTAALCFRYPILVWGDGVPSAASGVFGGGTTFGIGLASFGMATGYWLADSSDGSPAVDTEA